MKRLILKLFIIILIIALVSSYFIIILDDDKVPEENEDGNSAEGNNQDDDPPPENNSDDDEDINYEYYSFIEEATASWCTACPEVAGILDKLSSTDNKFYYVSLVHDKSDKSKDRLDNEYNTYGYPTVFIDGGSQVIVGNTDFEKQFLEKLKKNQERKRPDLLINIEPKWNESDNSLENKVIIQNNENETYNGRLKLYITEIQSRWADYNGDPYHYGLIDFGYDKVIKINSKENITIDELWESSKSEFSNIYPENLFVFAVVFNSEAKTSYANPTEHENSFKAYSVDAVVGTNISEGALPPTIGISRPKQWHRYIFDKEGKKGISGETIILGKLTIEAKVEAEAGVQKVDFIVTGELRDFTYTDNEAPYQWTWNKLALGRYAIKVIVTDKQGRQQEDTMDIIAFNI